MSRSAAPEQAAAASECVAAGEHADVWLFGDALIEWTAVCRKTDEKSRRAVSRLTGLFRRFASVGMRGFTEEQFKTLGRFKATGGNEVLIHEFKAHQHRVYGVVKSWRGRRGFLATAYDPAKRNNKADRNIIKRAVDAASNIIGEQNADE